MAVKYLLYRDVPNSLDPYRMLRYPYRTLDPDPRQNSRTVAAPGWQRFLLAPNFVNFHMEHHFMASVPCYRLPHLRRMLHARGYLQGVPECSSYAEVLAGVLRSGPSKVT